MVDKITDFLAAVIYHSIMLYFKIRYRSKWKDAVRGCFFKGGRYEEQPVYNFVTDKTYSSENFEDYKKNVFLASELIDGGVLVRTEKYGYLMINPKQMEQESKENVN